MTAREAIQKEWECFRQECYGENAILPHMNEVERAFHGGIMVGLCLNLDYNSDVLVTTIEEWSKTSMATATFRQDKLANWTRVTDALPANGQVVETMIQNPHIGIWCLIQRQFVDGSWYDKHARPDGSAPFPPPTHWHAI